ncbi:GNAT family N-acetyltransferase [Azotobacter sp. CWF10]
MIEIRRPSIVDGHAISALLNSLGYPDTESFIERRINQLVAHQDADILVATVDGTVVGFVSLHFIPQLALDRDFCRITYFCVSEAHRNLGIGSLLESKVVSLAKSVAVPV